MIHQLRIYEIFEANKAAFHRRFRDHAWRIMKRYGFEILAFWETEGPAGTAFAYLLSWSDEAACKAAWQAFMADEEWQAIKRETAADQGNLIGAIEDRMLLPTDYSPLLGAG